MLTPPLARRGKREQVHHDQTVGLPRDGRSLSRRTGGMQRHQNDQGGSGQQPPCRIGVVGCRCSCRLGRGLGQGRGGPGTAARNTGGDADVGVSCASAGNCSAGGNYEHDFSDARSFVVGEKNGTWGKAERVVINGNGRCAHFTVVRIGGQLQRWRGHQVSPSNFEAFVVGEKNGTWGKAERVLINGTGVGLISLSCASAGNCSAGGEYVDTSDLTQAFVVGEKNGTWGKAEEVPGTAVLNKGGYATLNVLSCASAGNCSAGGTYSYASGRYQAFVAGERNGTWGKAEEVPGIAALNRGGHAVTGSVSCAAAGNCSAGGFYTDGSGHQQAFVAGETNGAWARPRRSPAPEPSTRADTRGLRCRAHRRATAASAGTTPTAPVACRLSWPGRGTAPGARPRRSPAPRA